ncbi:MAG: hypothetical protein B6U89_02345 [Desulfurococcales archaeon ex4484_58]|nr:MAG: hypothetical protein B6U89_02345 [Desulfurococcales archaeon ex4484_58]
MTLTDHLEILLIGDDTVVLDRITSLISKIIEPLKYRLTTIKSSINSISLYHLIINKEGSINKEISYIVILDNIPLEKLIDKYNIKEAHILETKCREERNSYCIKENNEIYITSTLLSIIGIPLKQTLKHFNKTIDKKKVIEAYTYTIYRRENKEIKRIKII